MSKQMKVLPKLLDARQLGEQLSMRPNTLYRMALEGRIPCWRIGRNVRFNSEEVAEVLEKGHCRAIFKVRQPKIFEKEL